MRKLLNYTVLCTVEFSRGGYGRNYQGSYKARKSMKPVKGGACSQRKPQSTHSSHS